MKRLTALAAGCCILLACNNQPAETTAKPDSTATTAATATNNTPQNAEFADPKYAEIGKSSLEAMSKGDVNGFLKDYAENAVFIWSSGDSLVGLPAITKFWADRRSNVIDSISFSNDIWLPIKINKSQRGPDQPGIWLLGWFQFITKYKNGAHAMGWVHRDQHFNEAGKIDRTIMYIDRAPINAVLSKK